MLRFTRPLAAPARTVLLRRFFCTDSTVESTISIDASRLRRNVPQHDHDHEPATGLLRELQSRIRFQGPITVAEYMTAALTHPVHGYYMKRDVFGRKGDFITSPEISQVFGDLLGVWCVSCWEQLGKPARVRLVECGPGRGTLMADVLRASAVFPSFHKALSVHLLEVSPYLRGAQRRTLTRTSEGDEELELKTTAAEEPPLTWMPPQPEIAAHSDGVGVEWLEQLEDLPDDAPVLVLAHEFLDALPVHQLSRTQHGWRERLVELKEHVAAPDAPAAPADGEGEGAAAVSGAATAAAAAGTPGAAKASDATAGGEAGGEARRLEFVVAATRTPAAALYAETLDGHGEAEQRQLLHAEVCPSAQRFAALVARRLAASGGAALLIDYGQDGPPADSLRGIIDHKFVDPLLAPGEADLSVDVDFDAVRRAALAEAPSVRVPPLQLQRDFLAAMGLEQRVNALLHKTDDAEQRRDLISSAGRLVETPGMGAAYKALALAHPRPAGHAVGSTPMDHIAGFPPVAGS